MIGEGFDPDGAKDMIAESLRASIGGVKPEKIDQVRREILAAEGTSRKDKYLRNYLNLGEKTAEETGGSPSKLSSMENIQVESLLIGLYEIYDSLIDIFQRVGLNHDISDKLSTSIWDLEKCITKVGGSVKAFVPEDFVSGLSMPNSEENAKNVIATTKKCYKLGKVEQAEIEENGNAIRLVFSGSISSGVSYRVIGLIKAGAKGWSGNEAIDYIYKQGGGKMSVRSVDGGSWVNRSTDFDIKWELEETFPEAASNTVASSQPIVEQSPDSNGENFPING